MTNPTPVAWFEWNTGPTIQLDHSFDFLSLPSGKSPLFTAAQLNQAKADALREAAERFDGCYVTSNHPQIGYGIAAELRRMAAEVEGEK